MNPSLIDHVYVNKLSTVPTRQVSRVCLVASKDSELKALKFIAQEGSFLIGVFFVTWYTDLNTPQPNEQHWIIDYSVDFTVVYLSASGGVQSVAPCKTLLEEP